MLEAYQWVLLCLLGGWVAVDGAAWGQFMISRPFVAAVAAGAIVGSPAQAAQLGLVLEALHLRVLPVGAARYPESGPAAVVGGASSAALGGSSAVLTALVFVLVWEWIGGESIRQLRNRNTPGPSDANQGAARLERQHLGAIALDWGRGVLLVVVGIPLLLSIGGAAEPLLAGYQASSNLLLSMALAAGLASAIGLFGVTRARFALAGVTLGMLFVVLR